MLVLNRKKGETIVIGDNIEITIIDVLGDNIKVGINAPKEVGIVRKEIKEEIAATNKQATQSTPNLQTNLQALNQMAKEKGAKQGIK
ncbi:MAG: carbon storage regulator CsrA [Bacillota bacterium]|nr:carbon storage regulator CsrA [Bacillota bacterium]